MSYKSELLRCFEERGFIHDISDGVGLDGRLLKSRVTAYIGFDATASSLHVGSLLQIMMLMWMQKFGHKPIVLLGGGTTMVGDPSGRDSSRQILTTSEIGKNQSSLKEVFKRFLSFGDASSDALMLNNADWLCDLNYLNFMREVGSYFSLNRMMSFDSVRLRLEREQHLSLLEFNYMVLQAYDFMVLHRDYGCDLQMGGSDQWGNIVSGIDLTRRILSKEIYGLTSPLLTKSDGGKMGKTAKGAVWLKEELLSSYDYWQFWRNSLDQDVGRFLRLFTELPISEINRLEKLQGREINEAKIVLAREATSLCHGREKAEKAERTAKSVFGRASKEDQEDLPTVYIDHQQIKRGIQILQVIMDLNMAVSKSESRRLITQGGVKLNDETIQNHEYCLEEKDFSDSVARIRVGKKRWAQIIIG